MEPQGWKTASPPRATKRNRTASLSKSTRSSRAPVQAVGLDAETKIVPAPSRRRNISLDIPFYRTWLCNVTIGDKHKLLAIRGCPEKDAGILLDSPPRID